MSPIPPKCSQSTETIKQGISKFIVLLFVHKSWETRGLKRKGLIKKLLIALLIFTAVGIVGHFLFQLLLGVVLRDTYMNLIKVLI